MGKKNVYALHGDVDQILGELLGVTGETSLWESPEPTDLADNDYLYGCDILGASVKPVVSPKRAGFVVRKTPRGRTYTSLVLNKDKPKSKHLSAAASIANARDAGRRAVSIGKKLKAALAKAPLPKPKTAVHGAGPVRPAPKGITRSRAGAFLTSAKLKQIADYAIKVGKEALKGADAHAAKVQKDDARVAKGVALARKKTFIGSDDGYTEIVGQGDSAYWLELIGAPTDPDPTNPGFLIDGTPDPTGGAPTDTTVAAPDAGVGPAPTLESVRAQILATTIPGPKVETDTTSYTSDASIAPGDSPLPEDAVIFDGSRNFQNMDVGSFNYYTGGGGVGDVNDNSAPGIHAPVKNGFVLNQGGWTGGAVSHGSGWMAVRQGDMSTISDSEAPDLAENQRDSVALQKTSIRYGWGPLVGRPAPGAWTRGLKFDPAGKRWFWFRSDAPAWATAAEDQVELNRQMLDYKALVAAAAADAAAQAAQNQLDQQQADALAKQQAQEDAAMARQQDVQQQQQDAAAQADTAQQTHWEQGQGQAQAELELLAQKSALEWQVAHPEEGPPEVPDFSEQGGGGDQGGEAGPDQGVDWGQPQQGGGGQGGEDFTAEEVQQYQDAGGDARAMDEE